MEKITVIGAGYVGLVTSACLAELNYQVVCCDIDQEKIANLQLGLVPIFENDLERLIKGNISKTRLRFSVQMDEAINWADIIFIAVGTPLDQNNKLDLKPFDQAIKKIRDSIKSSKIIVIKSTVPVGTAQRVNGYFNSQTVNPIPCSILSNPEFLREGSAVYDFFNPDRIIIGGEDQISIAQLKSIYRSIHGPIVEMNWESAEMVKYGANSFLAMKISYINDIAHLCELSGADVSIVAKGIGLDSRIGQHFLRAGIGFGGSCLPKDVCSFIQFAEDKGYSFDLLKSVLRTNQLQIERMINKLQTIFDHDYTLQVAILGLSFKPNTDDVRNAPSLQIIERLRRENAQIRAYDPVATEKAKKVLRDNTIEYFQTAYAALENADVAVILTEWKEITELDLNQAKKLMKRPVILDGRNCFEPKVMADKGFLYYSIGREIIEEIGNERE